MVFSESWRGPFNFTGNDAACPPNASSSHAGEGSGSGCRWWHLLSQRADERGLEDPFVYSQPDSDPASGGGGSVTFHALFHDHTSFGGHAFSRDGASWTFSDVTPFGNNVTYADGGSVALQRRERPHLVFDAR